ncbi:MAG: hypothetical protein U0234_29155 [Sandaracinus sp.]
MAGRATSSEETDALESGRVSDPSGVSSRPREGAEPARTSKPDLFDDVTPPKAVSIYDLDEDLPTRHQSSDEIAQFQKLAREKRGAAAMKTFAPPREGPRDSSPGAGAPPLSNRPIPRESGPIRIDRPRPPDPDPDLASMLEDVAKGLERLPAAPAVPEIEQPRTSLERIPRLSDPVAAPASSGGTPSRTWRTWAGVVVVIVAIVAVALAVVRFGSFGG